MTTLEIILVVVLFLNILLSIYLFIKVQKSTKNINLLTKDVKGKNLEELLKEHLKKVDKNSELISKIKSEFKNFEDSSKSHMQKVGFKRFNPFHETGGDQSFSIALLNQNNDGFILSSLHQRELTRVYAKRIKNGKSEQKLSKEEEDLLNKVTS